MVNIQKGKQPIRNNDTPKINSNEPYKMRITSGGSISSYVDFAVRFLHDNPHTPLILHTLPPTDSTTNPISEAGPSNPKSYSTTFLQCTTTIPRLISVVEIIKRTYLSQIRVTNDGPNSNPNQNQKRKQIESERIRISKGIWQYTESALYHPPIPQEREELGEEGGMNSLERVLGGKTKPKMTHHPYLTITLSTKPLGLEEKRNVTVQYVLVKKKNRNKNGKGKGNEREGVEIDGDEIDDDGEQDGVGMSEHPAKNGAERSKITKESPQLNKEINQSQVNRPKNGIKRNSDDISLSSLDKDKIGKKRKIT